MKLGFLGALTAAAEEDLPLWQAIGAFFYDCFFGELAYYEHLDTGSGRLLSVRLIIVGVFLGFAAGFFVTAYNKQVLGGFVRHLLKNECLSPETGRTLPELDYADRLSIRRAVRKSVSLRRVVRCREEDAYYETVEDRFSKKTKEFRVDPDNHHFYIPEEMKYMADVKFEAKGATWRGAILFSILMVVLMIAVLACLPYILTVLDRFVGAVKA